MDPRSAREPGAQRKRTPAGAPGAPRTPGDGGGSRGKAPRRSPYSALEATRAGSGGGPAPAEGRRAPRDSELSTSPAEPNAKGKCFQKTQAARFTHCSGLDSATRQSV